MSLNELAAEIHNISREHGFWPKEDDPNPIERNPGEVLMLIVTEAAEAMEAHRDNKWEESVSWHAGPDTANVELRIDSNGNVWGRIKETEHWYPMPEHELRRLGFIPKPEGVASELADVIIRTLDAAAAWDFDIDEAVRRKVEYNRTREILHGRAR